MGLVMMASAGPMPCNRWFLTDGHRKRVLPHPAGPWAGRSVIFFQQIASLGNNITLGIVAGISMKVCCCLLRSTLPQRS